ncbi:DctP family TRAP transporter solute-binding subunit [Solimicrobium silvestre]|nr:DctP family TRAP transporter solute-binding subunit [Solimicrobium silvestre]
MITGSNYAQTTIVIKFSHVVANDSPKGLAAIHFKELAEKMTKGRVRVDVYPNSKLYKDNEELEALQLGVVQMLAPSLSKLSALGFHEFEVFDLPYLFPNKEALHRVTQGPIGRDLLSRLETKNIVGLGIWDNGFKSMSANKPIHTPDDMRGLKMRIQPSKVIATQMRDLGATPLTLSFTYAIDSLRFGLADGTENPPSNFYMMQFIDLQKYLTLTNHGYLGYAVIVNKKFWEDLPAEIRVQLSSAMNETTKFANAMAQQQNELDLAAIRSSGKTTVYELTEAERIQWRKALLPVQQQMETRIGKETLNAVTQEVGNSHE